MAEMADFPCTLTLDIPFPTPRLATIALKALAVDQERSPLVRRTISTTTTTTDADAETVLRAKYSATTNRMLRVAVNSFVDSLKLVMEVMEKLDVDVVPELQ